MSLAVLQSRQQIQLARAELRRRGLSAASGGWARFLGRLHLSRDVVVGDVVKSWDVLRTATFLEEHLDRGAAVLDLGAYASEILCVLRRLGFTSLTGVDLNPHLARMPYADAIHYETGDFLHTPFPDASFDAITAISVIEHGFRGPELLAEVRRLLRDRGYFVASFDYWPEKIPTDGVKAFGMDWRIFSRQEVLDLVELAKGYDLEPVGPLELDAQDAAISWSGRRYSFGWLALQRRSRAG